MSSSYCNLDILKSGHFLDFECIYLFFKEQLVFWLSDHNSLLMGFLANFKFGLFCITSFVLYCWLVHLYSVVGFWNMWLVQNNYWLVCGFIYRCSLQVFLLWAFLCVLILLIYLPFRPGLLIKNGILIIIPLSRIWFQLVWMRCIISVLSGRCYCCFCGMQER